MGRVKDAATVERIEDLFKRGQLEQWEQELKAFSNGHEERGKIYFIQSQVRTRRFLRITKPTLNDTCGIS